MTVNKNAYDITKVFETFMAFGGDVSRTAVACNLSIDEIKELARLENWHEKVQQWNTLREGSTADVSIQVNRAVNFVQSHRVRSLIDAAIGQLLKLSPEELMDKLTTKAKGKDGEVVTLNFSARALTDLVKAAETAHLMTQRALGDTVAERPESQETRKGSSIALLVQAAMSAADDAGLDSVEVVKKQLANPAAYALPTPKT